MTEEGKRLQFHYIHLAGMLTKHKGNEDNQI